MSHRWYVLHVYSGNENKVAEAIIDKAKKVGLEDKFEQILVPTHEVTEVRRGKKVAAEKKFFPGYVLVRVLSLLSTVLWKRLMRIKRVSK